MRIITPMLWTVVGLSVLIPAAKAKAQAQPQGSSLLVIVVQQAPKDGGHVEVLLAAGKTARNIVYVDRTASASDLDAGIEIVRHLRGRFGDTLTRDIRATPRPSRGPKPAPNSAQASRLERLAHSLRTLDARSPGQVPKVGKVKSYEVITAAYPPKHAR